mmetsp:Transcript_34585/g.98394  ORF Transcript_34585/g.98394 Transcript_34585/m.98394 type:complete len:273 (-) Transcript_34585:464-1282(-)
MPPVAQQAPVGVVVRPLHAAVPLHARPWLRELRPRRPRLGVDVLEEGGVLGRGRAWHEWRDSAMEMLEIHLCEERLQADLLRGQALRPVGEQPPDEALRRVRCPAVAPRLLQAPGEEGRVVQDLVLDDPNALRTAFAARVEGHYPGKALEGDHAHGPKVRLGAGVAAEALWRHVLRRANDAQQPPAIAGLGVGPLGVHILLAKRGAAQLPVLAQAEVQKLQVPGHADDDIVGLYVAMHEAAAVQRVQSLEQLSHVEDGVRLGEAPAALHVAD